MWIVLADFSRHDVSSGSQAWLKLWAKIIHNFECYHRKTSELVTLAELASSSSKNFWTRNLRVQMSSHPCNSNTKLFFMIFWTHQFCLMIFVRHLHPWGLLFNFDQINNIKDSVMTLPWLDIFGGGEEVCKVDIDFGKSIFWYR